MLGERARRASEALARRVASHPLAAELIEPLLGPTLRADDDRRLASKRNVIPALCEIVGRLPAPARADAARTSSRRSARVLGEGDYELESLEAQGGTRSPLDTPLWDARRRRSSTRSSRARSPRRSCSAGFTDSHWLREAFGTVAYGFFPLRAMAPELAARLIHSADERVAGRRPRARRSTSCATPRASICGA